MRKLFGASCRELLTFLRLRVFGANLVTSLPPVLETAVHTLSVCRQACCQRTVWQCSMLSWWYPWLSPLLYRSKFWKQMISSLLSDSNRDRLWLWLWQRQLFLSCLELVKLDGVGPVDNRPSTNKLNHFIKKSRIWETKNLSTDADSRSDTIWRDCMIYL